MPKVKFQTVDGVDVEIDPNNVASLAEGHNVDSTKMLLTEDGVDLSVIVLGTAAEVARKLKVNPDEVIEVETNEKTEVDEAPLAEEVLNETPAAETEDGSAEPETAADDTTADDTAADTAAETDTPAEEAAADEAPAEETKTEDEAAPKPKSKRTTKTS